MNYITWNNLIAAHFFKPEMADRSVYLYVTEELIAEIGESSGADLPDFIKALKTGILGVIGKGICDQALSSLDYWKYRTKKRDYPLYIGYLALFVLAAGKEGDFSANAYYPRLAELIGEEIKTSSFNEMWKLWEHLEQWANEDKSGELGIFNKVIAGKRNHVGLPIAQTLLTEEELKALPIIFVEADLDPTSSPSETAIAFLLQKHGRKYLRKRTLHILEETKNSSELRQALIERIIDELREWDGTTDLLFEGQIQVYGLLRLCCQLDSISGCLTMTMRCTTKHEFPEDGFLLFLNNNSDSFSCDEYSNGWSSSIKSELNDQNINAAQFDWCEGLRIKSADQKWCFKLPASPVRIFVKGDSQGLSGFIEVGQLPKGSPFYLAAHQDCDDLLQKWGTSGCEGFEQLSIVSGLPSGWHFFKVAAAHNDELVKNKYPILSLTTTVRLNIEGGIRLDKSNRFFKFAPPKIVLQGGNESVKVYCNEILLDCIQAPGIYELPTDIPSETKLVIEARQDQEILKRRSLSLVEDFLWKYQVFTAQFDSFGYRQLNTNNNSMGVNGAVVKGVNFPAFNFNTFLPNQGKQRIFYIGKEPGQIAIEPEDLLTIEWSPIWAICQGRRRQATFCGTSLVESEPTQSICKDRKKLRVWKDLLWYDRKKTLAPTGDRRIKELWQRFKQEAERVKG